MQVQPLKSEKFTTIDLLKLITFKLSALRKQEFAYSTENCTGFTKVRLSLYLSI